MSGAPLSRRENNCATGPISRYKHIKIIASNFWLGFESLSPPLDCGLHCTTQVGNWLWMPSVEVRSTERDWQFKQKFPLTIWVIHLIIVLLLCSQNWLWQSRYLTTSSSNKSRNAATITFVTIAKTMLPSPSVANVKRKDDKATNIHGRGRGRGSCWETGHGGSNGRFEKDFETQR